METNLLWHKVDPWFPGEGGKGTGVGWEGLSRCTWKTFGDNGHVHHLDYGDGFMDIYKYQNISNCIL